MRKSPNQRRKAPSKQSGNTQQDPTNNRVHTRLKALKKKAQAQGPISVILSSQRREKVSFDFDKESALIL